MLRRILLGTVVVGMTGCTPGAATGSGGDGGGTGSGKSTTATGTATTAASGTRSTGASSSTGAGECKMGDPCLDNDPCTDDACEVDTCKHTPKAVGSPGNTTEGACVGVCQSDGACGLRLYSRTFPGGSGWDANAPALSTVWTGTNAPPPRGILSAAHAHANTRLFVWASDGMLYWSNDTGWNTPVPIATATPGLTAANVKAIEMYQGNPGDPQGVLAFTTGTTPRRAYLYTLGPGTNFTPDAANPYNIGPVVGDPQAGPQDTVDCDWGFTVQTAYVGTADWVIFWRHFGTKVYEYNGGNNDWMANWDEASSPVFAGSISMPGPTAGTIVATYYDSGKLYAIAP